jgi:hypothetical protein
MAVRLHQYSKSTAGESIAGLIRSSWRLGVPMSPQLCHAFLIVLTRDGIGFVGGPNSCL